MFATVSHLTCRILFVMVLHLVLVIAPIADNVFCATADRSVLKI